MVEGQKTPDKPILSRKPFFAVVGQDTVENFLTTGTNL